MIPRQRSFSSGAATTNTPKLRDPTAADDDDSDSDAHFAYLTTVLAHSAITPIYTTPATSMLPTPPMSSSGSRTSTSTTTSTRSIPSPTDVAAPPSLLTRPVLAPLTISNTSAPIPATTTTQSQAEMAKSPVMHSVDALLEQINMAIEDLRVEESTPLPQKSILRHSQSHLQPHPHQHHQHQQQSESTAQPRRQPRLRMSSAPEWNFNPDLSATDLFSPISTHPPTLFPNPPNPNISTPMNVLHSGHLLKLTTTLTLPSKKTFRPRFLVLTPCLLFLFRSSHPSESSITALPIVPSTAAFVAEQGLWVLTVRSSGWDPAKKEMVGRTWTLQCEDKDEMVSWLTVLRGAIASSSSSSSSTLSPTAQIEYLQSQGRGHALSSLLSSPSASTQQPLHHLLTDLNRLQPTTNLQNFPSPPTQPPLRDSGYSDPSTSPIHTKHPDHFSSSHNESSSTQQQPQKAAPREEIVSPRGKMPLYLGFGASMSMAM
ncbi:hypothetical protein DFS34DRAFT_636483 [Phlyctochytrium arcticum]|nr:hypothetical protein DFS34DRAFT_636483 [Phlyctochytrium arcticum]